jgi:hypothetical protein
MRFPSRALLIIGACLLPWILSAATQVVCGLGSGVSSYNAYADQHPSADALQLAARTFEAGKTICGPNCPEVVLFRNATAANLMLVTADGRAKIVYAPAVFTGVYDHYGDAGVIALIAHALGHAFDDLLGAAWIEKGWTPELRADAWGGCILARSSLAPVDVTAALAALAEYPSPAHPAWSVRLPVINSGYAHCRP